MSLENDELSVLGEEFTDKFNNHGSGFHVEGGTYHGKAVDFEEVEQTANLNYVPLLALEEVVTLEELQGESISGMIIPEDLALN